jgi:N-acetylmuramoyl-L-alanine amidase
MQVLFEVRQKFTYPMLHMRLIVLFTLLCLPFMPARATDNITAVRIGDHIDKTRIVLDMTGDTNFSVYVQDSPKSLIINVPTKSWSIDGDPYLKPPFKTVSHLPIVADGLSRISLSLDAPYKIRNAYMMPADNKNPNNRLVIDIEPTTQTVFVGEIGRSFGTLNVKGTKQPDMDSLLQSIAGAHVEGIPISQAAPVEKPPEKPIIVIDAGHGGQDPGAISPGGIYEKRITLSMAKTIARILNATGKYDARLTRSTDVYIKLHDRVKIARAANADLFISIHADSVGNKNTKGASVYTLSNTASDKQSARLAARENRSDIIAGVDLAGEDPDVSLILLDLSMRETMNQSKTLANKVVQSFTTSGVGTLKGPHRYAGFAVLKAPDVPSVLIETGFVSNEAEAKRLLSPAYQNRIGKALLASLNRYFSIE